MKQRTLLLAAPYYPPHVGGAENYVHAMASLLHRKYDWRVVVVTTGTQRAGVAVTEEEGIRVYRLPFQWKVSNTPVSLLWVRQFKRIIADERPDIINAHTPVPLFADIIALANDTVPLVVTYHTGKTEISRGLVIDAMIRTYERLFVQYLLGKARAIVSSSDFVKNTFLRSYPDKTVTITPGVDLKRFRPAGKPTGKQILFVGSLNKAEQYKELATLLAALPHLRKQHPDARVIVAGGGDYEQHYQRLAERYGVTAMVRFVGRLHGEDLVKAYQRANVFVLPSVFDSCPLVLLEAMACGRPVIGADTSGIPYLITHGKNGFLFPPRDAEALADCIGSLLSNPALATAMGKRGRTMMEERFTWERQAESTNVLFRRVLRNEPAVKAERKKLLMVAPYYLPHVGGVENYVANISTRLRDNHGWDVVIVTANKEDHAVHVDLVDGLKVYRLPAWFTFFNTPVNPLWRWHLKGILWAEQPDIVNGHTPVPYMADLAMRVARDQPRVLSYYNDLVKDKWSERMVAKAYYAGLGLRTLSLANRIVILSKHYADHSPYLQRFQKKLTIISPGVDPEQFHPKLDTTWLQQRFPGKKIVLFVGQLDKTHQHKGLTILLEAVSIAQRFMKTVHLVVVGQGNYRGHYEQQARALGIARNVTFAGFVSNADLPRYYAGAHVTVLPATNASEGFGMVLMEAAACSCATIGTNVGGIPYAIDEGKTGLLVPPKDASALANAMIQILRDERTANDFGRRGSAKARADFTWNQKAKQYNDMLRRLR